MKAVTVEQRADNSQRNSLRNERINLEESIRHCWARISSFWPLKSIVAVNPLAGFENLSFESGLKEAEIFFEQKSIPEGMALVNRETIKWIQVYLDEGQSVLSMPYKHKGFIEAMLKLIRHDNIVHNRNKESISWLSSLSKNPKTIIIEALFKLRVQIKDQNLFMLLMLTTLPGWASYVQYLDFWLKKQGLTSVCNITREEYLAFRLLLTSLLWPNASELVAWYQDAAKNVDISKKIRAIHFNEELYQRELLANIICAKQKIGTLSSWPKVSAQLVFCIDVRSEPLRHHLESVGSYDTYGFAGFFGIPMTVTNAITAESHAACPVLVEPRHEVVEFPKGAIGLCRTGYATQSYAVSLYHSLKYALATPFMLVEYLGFLFAIKMVLQNFMPVTLSKIKKFYRSHLALDYCSEPDIQHIPFEEQVHYASSILQTIGLTKCFSEIVVLCGHGGQTENNAFETSLDCGACGGYHGSANARVLAKILNDKAIRDALGYHGLEIPDSTIFIAALHNTTTDEVLFLGDDIPISHQNTFELLKQDLEKARRLNIRQREEYNGKAISEKAALKKHLRRAHDWSEPRPEWGLANNAAMIIGPRYLTRGIDLNGRCFLHSYDWEEDLDQKLLKVILTAPLIVAQWINAQYLFSTMNNVSYGAGSKVTKNVTGKLGVMQGNASDLMTGLPLQSVNVCDAESYHQVLRLTAFVYAPRSWVLSIIKKDKGLRKLLLNGWLHLMVLDPQSDLTFVLDRSLSWKVTRLV